MLRRTASLIALVLVAACGSLQEGSALSGGAAPSPSPGAPLAKRPLPPADPTLKGCLADWFEGFLSLPPLVDRADLIVRARTVSTMTSQERWGLAYRTTLRVDRVLKGPRTSTVTVLESACPVISGGPQDWLLFLVPKLDDPAVFQVPGGIQGAFPIKAGSVSPIYGDQMLVRMYGGVNVTDVEREVTSIHPIDGDAAAILRTSGWRTTTKFWVRMYELTPASQFGETKLPPRVERPFEGYARIAAVTGLDLRPFAGREIEELGYLLEGLPAEGKPYPPTAHLVFADRAYVGGWVQVDATQFFRLDDRAGVLAATPRQFAPTPAPNRYPNGVNVVTEYGLGRATSAYVKPGVPSGRPAAPPLDALLAALDHLFPTETAPPPRDGPYWVVGFTLAERYLAFEYYPDTGLLVQRDDGYAIRPDTSFAQLVGAAR